MSRCANWGLDAQIRTLRLRRGVLAAVVKRAADGKEMAMMNALARLSAAERRQIIDDFTAEVFAGLDPSPARFARWAAGPDLPEDPSPEQVEAWIELAGLASDPDFRQRIRKVVTEVVAAGPFWPAEEEHQDYLQKYPDGYTCHFPRPGWALPKRATA